MPPDPFDIGEAIRTLALLVMTVPMLAGFVPPLRPYQRRIWQVTAVLYVVGGTCLLVGRYLIWPLVSGE